MKKDITDFKCFASVQEAHGHTYTNAYIFIGNCIRLVAEVLLYGVQQYMKVHKLKEQ